MGYKEGEWKYCEESTCATCGKKFFPAPQHALYDKYGVYCKPTCFLHRKKKYDYQRKVKRVVQLDDDGAILNVFNSANDAAETLPKVCADMVREACRKGVRYKGCWWRYED